MPRGLLVWVALLACAWGAWQSWKHREQDQPPGVLVGDEPLQTPTDSEAAEFAQGRFHLRPRANYRIDARLLARERYRADAGAELAPLDFAVGWGPMSDSAVIEALDISQSNRYFHVAWRQPPIPESEILGHSANMHLIPAGASVERALDRMRPGQVVRLEGHLVNAVRDDGWTWNSSLSRTDTGGGACELMWVNDAQVLQ